MKPLALCVALAAIAAVARAEGDASRGAQMFRHCAACHSITPGEHLTGPSLAQAWNRRAGTVEGFRRYSEALRNSGFVWDAATLGKWLADPQKLVPGTTMTFPGVKQEKDRQDIAAYLQALAENKAPPQAQGQGGMRGMQRARPDLRKAPPEGLVTSLKHCGDTYTVETADGKSQKVWEFNLRFKTDSSGLGPAPGKPVIVGAGMQGDRASVVFAAAQEISAFIQASCK